MAVVGLSPSQLKRMTMKIAIFSVYPLVPDKPPGGVYAVTVVLARALATYDGAEVHVITLERGRTKTVIEQDGAVTVHRLPGSRWPQILDVHIGPGRRRLVKYIADLAPDVLHIHETYGLGLSKVPVPHVFTIHGFDHANLVANASQFTWIRSRLWRYAECRGFSKHRHIISITPYVRTMVESQTDAEIYDIDNPVDGRFFQVARRTEIGRILCVGWINHRKNTLGSVEAFARLAKHHVGAKLVIAGEPQEAEYYQRVKESIERSGISDKVEVVGHIDRAQLEQELAKASVFLLPSRQENAPMAIAEAMAAGVPVVASNRCGMPYMVQEGKTGFLIDPESTEEIAERLARLLDSPELCVQMGQASRQVATERFHPNAVAGRTMAVYRRVCAGA